MSNPVAKADNLVVHPGETLQNLGSNERTVLDAGDSVFVLDSDGNRLLDGPAGMWCVNAGYSRPEIIEAINKQLESLAYTSPWAVANAPAAKLAEVLAALSPGDLNHVFYTTGGSTAVDSALRFVMFYNNYTGRPEKKHLIARHKAYHGSTYLTASVSGRERDKPFFDFERNWVHHISAPDPYRRAAGMRVEDFCDGLIDELEAEIAEIGADRVAAFIAEPVLASGGVIVPPPGYQERCLEVCREHDIIYIADEVVTGFGRLGHWFASEAVFNIVPDIITSAKGLTSGYIPLGAVLISDRLLEPLRDSAGEKAVFNNGFTYSGHPVACAAALANLDLMRDEEILEHVREVGPYLQNRLGDLSDIPIVGDVRGIGLMGCVECVISRDSKDPLVLDYEIGRRIDAHCQELGLLVRPLINMCVMSPPLTISRDQIDFLVDTLRQGIERAMQDVRNEGLWDG